MTSDNSLKLLEQCKVVLLDVAGTTTSVTFVKHTLFPYVAENVETFLKGNWELEDVKIALKLLNKDKDVLEIDAAVNLVKDAIDKQSNNAGLKTINGLIYKKGYEDGTLKAHVFPDVPPALAFWSKDRKLAIFSTGSVESQKLLFKHTTEGDLSADISNYFDQAVGLKTEKESYLNIAKELNVSAEEILFISDLIEELKAAKEAGLLTVWINREGSEDCTSDFTKISSFSELIADTSQAKRKNEDENGVEEEPPTKVSKVDQEVLEIKENGTLIANKEDSKPVLENSDVVKTDADGTTVEITKVDENKDLKSKSDEKKEPDLAVEPMEVDTDEAQVSVSELDKVVCAQNTEAVTDKNTETVVDKNTETVVDKNTETVVDKNTETVVDKNTEDVEKNTEAIVEKNTEAIVEKNTAAVVDKNAEAVVDKNTEAVVDKNTEAVVDKNTEAVVDKNAEVVVEINTEAVVDKHTEADVDKNTEAVVEKMETEELKDSVETKTLENIETEVELLKPSETEPTSNNKSDSIKANETAVDTETSEKVEAEKIKIVEEAPINASLENTQKVSEVKNVVKNTEKHDEAHIIETCKKNSCIAVNNVETSEANVKDATNNDVVKDVVASNDAAPITESNVVSVTETEKCHTDSPLTETTQAPPPNKADVIPEIIVIDATALLANEVVPSLAQSDEEASLTTQNSISTDNATVTLSEETPKGTESLDDAKVSSTVENMTNGTELNGNTKGSDEPAEKVAEAATNGQENSDQNNETEAQDAVKIKRIDTNTETTTVAVEV